LRRGSQCMVEGRPKRRAHSATYPRIGKIDSFK
jgi:hypothetical protein